MLLFYTLIMLPIILIKYKLMIRQLMIRQLTIGQSFIRILRVQESKSEVTKLIDI
jgi:hypothetical protein